MRRLALFKSAQLPADEARAQAAPAASERLSELESLFGPRRRFRQTSKAAASGETERVSNVLREYGTLGGAGGEQGDGSSGLGESYAQARSIAS